MSHLESAIQAVDRARLIALTRELVNVASPTGGEEPLAHRIVEILTPLGVETAVQSVAPGAANAWGRTGGSSDRSLLLYAPLDTVTAGNAAEDTPWAGPSLRPDMAPQSFEENGWVVGLGAHNPKGHAACVLMAFEALVTSGAVEFLDGEVMAGFGCLGMPANRRAPELADGHGAGCAALIATLEPSSAVIAKSGWAVSWTEVGLLWLTVEVFGTHTYVGSRHLIPYRSAIADAAHVIAELEAWFPEWAQLTADDMNSPQGVVASVTAGHERVTAFTPDVCRFTVDLRLAPAMDPIEAERIFTERVEKAAAAVGAAVRVHPTVSIPGTITDPAERIITTSIDAWEEQSGRPHEPIRGLSGATDANILRQAGVPTARAGLPKVSSPGVDVDFQYGMNAVNPDDQVQLTHQLIRTVFGYLGESS